MADPDLIIFDCDGVLVDSELISCATLAAMLQPFGLAVDRDYVIDHFLGRSFPTVARTLREQHRLALPDDFEQRYRESVLATFEAELQATEGLEAFLDTLDRPMAVATSSSPPRVARTLALTGLDRFFSPDRVFTASEVANGKPAPDLFLHVAARMGVAPWRCLVIEDSLPGLRAAVAACMPVWRYVGAGHLRDNLRARRQTLHGVPQLECWSEAVTWLAPAPARTGAIAPADA